ncbi:MAG TPA: hypothetical protein VIF09_07395 [Polyangiaceae bacterium]|jgi:hypothetical protein
MTEPKAPSGKPERVDALLASWPAPTRPGVEWDEAAELVVARITDDDDAGSAAFSAVSDEDLLSAPLPPEPGEVQSSAPIGRASEGAGMSTTSRERDRNALRDLAKMANMTAPPSSSAGSSGPVSSTVPAGHATKEDSGVINLAALAASEGEAQASSKASGVSSAAAAGPTLRSAAEPSRAQEAAPSTAREPAREPRRQSPWVTVGGMVAAAAVAAGVFFGLQRTQRGEAPGMLAAVPSSPAQATATALPAAVPAPLATIAPADRGVDPSTLPAAGMGTALAPHVGVPSSPKPGGAAGPAPAPTTEPALVAAVPPASPAPSGSAQNLQSLMQQAAGVTSSPTAATATADTPDLPAPGSVPLRPSLGAIQGALGAALPSARSCLGPDDPISRATITFASDGSVQNVSISGGAAGKPAEACIRSALSRARVSPFAQPTFTASTTVRPN